MQSSGRLNYHLGNWKSVDHIGKFSTWQYYFQPSISMVYYKDDEHYISITTDHVRKTTSQINPTSQRYCHNILPNDCIPAVIVSNKNNTKTVKFSSNSSSNNIIISQDSVEEWSDPMTTNLNIINEDRVKAIAQDDSVPLYIISDGGVHNYEGNFGVIISDGSSPIASTNGKLYSVDFFESSFRSEMYSMLAGIMSLRQIHKTYNIHNANPRKLYLYSDNKPLIKKVNNRIKIRRTVNQHRDSDVDLELQLLHELAEVEKLNFTITISFVRSHQELKKSKSALFHEETMNVLADRLTKEARAYKTISKYQYLLKNPISFNINKFMINSKYSQRSKIAYHSVALRPYLMEKHQWKDHTIDKIWWKVYHQSLTSLEEFEETIIFKFIHDKLPTNKREHRHYNYKDQHCNQCQEPVEDEDHIIRCFSHKRKNL